MADVSVNMGVSGIAQFKQGMSDAQASVKTFDAALKANEKQLRATGDAETFMQAQTTLLNGKLREQQNIAKNAEQAMRQMEQNGVKTTSKSYQDMQRRLIEAQSSMLDTQMELDNLGNKATEATGKTDQLANSLGGLNKRVSLEQVRSGISSITNAMEQAARKAVDLGRAIWDEIMDSARWADDTATLALNYGIDVEKIQQMQALVGGGMETTVENMLQAQDKLKKGIGSGSDTVIGYLTDLQLMFQTGKGSNQLVTDDTVDLFFRAGQAIMAMGDAYDKEAAAQALFGRGWKDLTDLFTRYKSVEEYNAALEEQHALSAKQVEDMAAVNDKVQTLERQFKELEHEVISAFAPELGRAADALSGLLGNVLDYLEKPEGQQALEDLRQAVSGLFDDLGSIDPAKVVEGITGVLNKTVSAVEWLVKNKDNVVEAMKWIVGGWGTLKIGGAVLDILKIINGISGLSAGAAASGAASAGAAAGASWASSFASAAMKAAPFLLPFALGIWQVSNYQQLMEEGKIKAAENRAHVEEATAEMETAMKDSDFAQTWKEATSHTMSTNTVDSGVLEDWAKRYDKWITEMGTDPIIDTLVENLSEDTFSELETLMRNVLDGGTLDPQAVADMMGKVQDELEAAGKKLEIQGQIDIPEDTAAALEEQIGELQLGAQVKFAGFTPMGDLNIPWISPGGYKANGIWSVPFDGYMAMLHKGEQVVPAREVASSRNFSSNLYVESMYMNSGMDAEGLAAAMAAANRRTMRGYGS